MLQHRQQQQPQAHNNNNVNITPGSVNITLPPQATGGMSPKLSNQHAKIMSAQHPVVLESSTNTPDYLKYGIIAGIAVLLVIVYILNLLHRPPTHNTCTQHQYRAKLFRWARPPTHNTCTQHQYRAKPFRWARPPAHNT